MIIVFLSGFTGSGKEFLASELVEKHGFMRLAFTDAVKSEVAKHYRIPLRLCNNKTALLFADSKRKVPSKLSGIIKRLVPTISMAQLLAMHAADRRRTDDFVYSRALFKRIIALPQSQFPRHSQRIVIPDWQYPADFTYIAQLAEKTVTCLVDRFSLPAVHDPSEYALERFPFDLVITNRGSIEEFREKVERDLLPLCRL